MSNTQETPVTYTHRIYGREKGKGRFKPLDLKHGRFVTNLIYASMLPESQALQALIELTRDNPDMEFQQRLIG
jgi:hypothetical protein